MIYKERVIISTVFTKPISIVRVLFVLKIIYLLHNH